MTCLHVAFDSDVGMEDEIEGTIFSVGYALTFAGWPAYYYGVREDGFNGKVGYQGSMRE